jgi:hypothetical protein
MLRILTSAVILAGLTLGLSACGEEEKAETKTPAKQVEKAEPQKMTTETKKDDLDMTPAEALENMKRDAGKVADKAVEAYDATKEAVTKAVSE